MAQLPVGNPTIHMNFHLGPKSSAFLSPFLWVLCLPIPQWELLAATFPTIGIHASPAFSQGLPRADSPGQEQMMDLTSQKQGLYRYFLFFYFFKCYFHLFLNIF